MYHVLHTTYQPAQQSIFCALCAAATAFAISDMHLKLLHRIYPRQVSAAATLLMASAIAVAALLA